MKDFESNDPEEINSLISHLNSCHDASLTKICFLKKRDVDKKDGSLIYPFEKDEDFINCDIRLELIHNNYKGAQKNQIVIFKFQDSKSFNFFQKNFDYSDIYELKFSKEEDSNLSFIFYSTKNKNISLAISCKKLICRF